MAGICGIIGKEKMESLVDYSQSLKAMMGKLACEPAQPSNYSSHKNYYFGNVSVISDTENKNFISNDSLGITCAVDGLVFIDNETKNEVIAKFQLTNALSDKELLPYIFSHFGDNAILKLTGWFNIFYINKELDSCFILNDRMGYLPLYYYENDSVFIFASKFEAIIASGLIDNIEFDVVSIVEHIFFNYVLSDNTFIQKIKTLGNATKISFKSNKTISLENYWTFEKLFSEKRLKGRAGLEKINNGFKKAISKLEQTGFNSFNFSLTGGWDSRLVLSYLKLLKDRLHTYSFGAENSPDITIPKYIADSEGFNYSPYKLDENYLQTKFAENARFTIMQSDGTRNFKRAHYTYALKLASVHSGISISGIFGDEVLKISQVKPCQVISKNAIDFISSDFNVAELLLSLKNHHLWNYIAYQPSLLQEFEQRMKLIKESVSNYPTLSQKYYHFRFMINLRKYFGAEVNSYNDYCYNFSPFIDIDFLNEFFQTNYCGVYHSFNKGSVLKKFQSTQLYCSLIRLNYPMLLEYSTDRGYTMKDAGNVFKLVSVLFKTFLNRKNRGDNYNTAKTTAIFKNNLVNQNPVKPGLPFNQQTIDSNDANTISMYYWLTEISSKYNFS